MKSARLLLVSLLLAGLAACLPTPRSAVLRYFTPLASPDGVPPFAAKRLDAAPLRLGRVRGATHLKERMVWRSDVESGFYELRRWTQPPADFLEQAVARELFERRGFRRAETGAMANLDIELRAFDEIVGPNPAALVQVSLRLTDARRVSLLERTISVRQPLDARDPATVARAMGEALAEAVRQIADGVEAALL